jgi:formate/nitrite transporter FocA (FNT family)
VIDLTGLVIIIGGELFTGNCMYAPLAFLSGEVPLKQVVKVRGFVPFD